MPPTRPLPLVFALALAAAALVGCAHVPLGAESPSVTTRGLSLRSAGLTGLHGTVHMNVFNPNGFSLPLRRAEFVLDIGGAELTTGDIDVPATIPARASAAVDASVAVDGLNAAAAAARYGAGERRYRLRGTLYFATAVGLIEVDVVHEGRVDELVDAAVASSPRSM